MSGKHDDVSLGTNLPPYVIRGEWKDDAPLTWEGPRGHPYGPEAYCIANVETGEVRIYPNREAAMEWALS